MVDVAVTIAKWHSVPTAMWDEHGTHYVGLKGVQTVITTPMAVNKVYLQFDELTIVPAGTWLYALKNGDIKSSTFKYYSFDRLKWFASM